MAIRQHKSLGEQISKKMSVWVLVLVFIITAGIFFVSYFLSKQVFNQQVRIWKTVSPQYALTYLIDSDYFSITREVKFLESTSLFSSFIITDNQKRVIAKFGEDNNDLIPIQDEAKQIWGYYSFNTNFYKYFSPFLIAGALFSSLVLFIYFIIRSRIRKDLEKEFFRFNLFLKEIEIITERISEIYNDDSLKFSINEESFNNIEQEIINRVVSRLFEEIHKANQSLRVAVTETEKKKFQEELTKTAFQVAHDVGSPLAALESIVQSTSVNLPEESRVEIRNVASRIRDIIHTLLRTTRHELIETRNEILTQYSIFSLLNTVISEKRLQFRLKTGLEIRCEFPADSHDLFAIVRNTDFNRVLSNLINNSVEALDHAGLIVVSLTSNENDVVITVKDNGVGIPKNILSRIGEYGVTYGKSDGSGLGLYHAIKTIESWGGKLVIESEIGKGTINKIFLPKSHPPQWFVPEIQIVDKQHIVIIDDDAFIHNLWKNRFENFYKQTAKTVVLYHFYSPIEFSEWMINNSQDSNTVLYLCDYEFIGHDENGMDLILRLKINYLSILVTSRVHSEEIINNCEISRIKLLPKDMAAFIPIN